MLSVLRYRRLGYRLRRHRDCYRHRMNLLHHGWSHRYRCCRCCESLRTNCCYCFGCYRRNCCWSCERANCYCYSSNRYRCYEKHWYCG